MDVFGLDLKAHSKGEIASSEFAKLSIKGGDSAALVQSISVNYAQQIEPITQVGDPNVYWLPGRPSGSLSVTRLVGNGGFFAGWKNTQCGFIDSMAVSVDGERCNFQGKGRLIFGSGVVESFSAEINSQSFTIRESMSVRISQLSAA